PQPAGAPAGALSPGTRPGAARGDPARAGRAGPAAGARRRGSPARERRARDRRIGEGAVMSYGQGNPSSLDRLGDAARGAADQMGGSGGVDSALQTVEGAAAAASSLAAGVAENWWNNAVRSAEAWEKLTAPPRDPITGEPKRDPVTGEPLKPTDGEIAA